MPTISSNRPLWTYLGLLFLAAALVLWFSPAERSLGTGIKSVYAHVALTWTGMTCLIAAGLLGLLATVSKRPALHAWLHAVGRVGMLFFTLGFATSLLSAKINWGAVFWGEPRIQASLRVVIAAAAVFLIAGSLRDRFRGLLYLALALFMIASIYQATLVMHPRNPIGLSSSLQIKLTFVGLYLFLLAAAALLAIAFRKAANRIPTQRT
ncbi:MAG: hypothetical protein Q9P90_14490 [candidate division KSB1 bacterium]|nr:hypothetical protein [candidate division KSB1 bacterium]